MKASLTATGLNFSTSKSGLSFTLNFDHPDKSVRVIYLTMAPASILTLKTHIIYTNVWSSKVAPSPALMTKALTMSKKLGFFYIYKDSQNVWAIRFGAHFDTSDLPAAPTNDLPAISRLKDTIYFVNQVGQEAQTALASDT